MDYDEDEDVDCGLPAQLHQEYKPSRERQSAASAVYHGEAAADIVLVHGLGSKYESTWTYKYKDGSSYRWIRDRLPQDLPDARILGFEYPSRWYNDPVHTNLTECASELLRSLIRDRCHESSQTMCPSRRKRPLIFVGHSFGGLVIKQAMTMASQVLSTNASRDEYENNRDLLSAIAGVIFLGTPHRGSEFSVLGLWKISFGSRLLQISSNDEIITILKPASYTLSELQRQFSTLCADERMAGLKLICYYEMREVPHVRRLVVSPGSATLDNAASRGMNANHMEMNTFHERGLGERDSDYDHFIADMQMLFNMSQTSVPRRFDAWRYGSAFPDAEREHLQRWLDPSRDPQTTTFHKRLEVQQSAPYTCHWVQRVPSFREWLQGDSKRDALWITGKAGSGKSVLAAYIIHVLMKGDVALNRDPDACLQSTGQSACAFKDNITSALFFFCGVDRNRESPDRILATMIHQLLLAHSESQELFEVAKELYLDGLNSSGTSSAALAAALAKMTSLVGRTYIIIDNLEDIGPAGILLERLAVLRSSQQVKFLFLSQETSDIADHLSLKFDVDDPLLITDYSANDITTFIETEGAGLLTKKPKLKDKSDLIMDSLRKGAQGMFQWVRSAFEHLRYVEDPRDVEASLHGIRQDLVDTYDKIFERLSYNRDELEVRRIQTSLKFLAVSATPVSSADVKIAYLVEECLSRASEHKGTKAECTKRTEAALKALLDHRTHPATVEVAESEIRAYLGSIVDICSDGTLQFKHPSIQRALIRPSAAGTAGSTSAQVKFSLEDAHRHMARLCMAVCQVSTFVHANSFIRPRVALVEYAWRYWAYHFKMSGYTFATHVESAQLRSLLQSHPNLASAGWKHQAALQETFDRMIESISRDALLYLEAFIDFISRPLRAVPGHFSDREYILSLQRAQESLLRPTMNLCSLRRSSNEPMSSKLQGDRKRVAAVVGQEYSQTFSLAVAHQKAKDRVSEAKSNIFGKKSAVSRLQLDEYLESNPTIPRPTDSVRLLLEIARDLRFVALRFAVDPIYSALLATADGASFSPLHPLVYIAQLLEECGQYAFWETLPLTTDPMAYFMCTAEDPEYAPARFVLHCFEWRDPKQETPHPTVAQPYGGVLESGEIEIRPSPSHHGLTRVSTENWDQVRRLHRVKPETLYTARLFYQMFHSDDPWLNKNVNEPLKMLHMRYSLLINPEKDRLTSMEPTTVFDVHVSPEIHEQPLLSWLRSVPSMMRIFFVEYVVALLRSFGRLTKQTLAGHFAKIEVAITELRQVAGFLSESMPRMNVLHLVPAALIFLLRCRYFPSWGSYFWFHSWSKFAYSYRHPAVYLEIQNEVRFWRFCWQMVVCYFNAVCGGTAMILSASPECSGTAVGHTAMVYSLFHCFCIVDRSLFAITAVVATVVACAQVMMHDMDTLVRMFQFSVFFWLNLFLQLVISGVQKGAQDKVSNWTSILVGGALRVIVLYLCLIYYVAIAKVALFFVTPIKFLTLLVWNHFFGASIFVAKALGGCCLLAMAFKAIWIVHKFIWDPHDIENRLKQLLQASQQARAGLGTGKTEQLQRVGWYPLGVRTVDVSETVAVQAANELGPARAALPLREVSSQVHEVAADGLNQAVGGVKRYFQDGTWQRHKEEIGELVDRAVLETGDQVYRVVDKVGEHVGRLAETPKQLLLLSQGSNEDNPEKDKTE